MAEALLLRPDRKFVEEVVAAGGGDLKKCFQCATCSVVCGLSNGSSPFPRKEMIWAQWGLKDRLFADPDVWLCHQCNDCSQRCPRGARPGDVLAAVRQKAIEHYAFPSIMGKWVNSLKASPVLLLLVPALLISGALLMRVPVERAFPGLVGDHGQEFYAHFFPHWLLIVFFSGLTLLTFGGLVVGLFRFWGSMKQADAARGRNGGESVGVGTSLGRAVKAVFSHVRFGECKDQASRKANHLMAFYGFLALFIVTCWAVADLYFLPGLMPDTFPQYPFDLAHPMKILANVGGVLLVVGAGKAILTRMRAPEDGKHRSTSFDWIFLWLLLGVGLTGFFVEVFRFLAEDMANRQGVLAHSLGLATPAYTTYLVHLVLVFGLLVYLPYSKFAHIWYRTVAMVYAEHTGRARDGRALVQLAVNETEKASEVASV
jgi:quinone-modifying oxidoreductase subunit QmoC